VSFCNGICTSKGGEHVKWIADDVAKKIIPLAKKAFKGVDIKASQIKHSMFVFINALISNPSFDSQTKETLTTRHAKFGPAEFKPKLSDKFCKDVVKNSDLVDEVLHYARAKVRRAMERKMGGSKKSKLSGIPKLDDANNAGGRKSKNCTLILTEGDSAKTLAIAGLSVIGRDNYGVFPLKGKLLNVRDASPQQILKNAEIQNIMKIMGLSIGKKYTDTSKLRYGHIMIMTDQDHDGSHIKGLIINFIHHFWPSLLEIPNFLQVFITPIVKCVPKTGSKAKKKKNTVTFYTTPEYEAWLEEDASHKDGKKWRIKYYKGLGTSDASEAKEYFAALEKNRIPFTTLSNDPTGPAMAGMMIDMCFSKNKVCLANRRRKIERRKRRRLVAPAGFVCFVTCD
jgi:DNA topoisomerase-2